jgi:hypothetical protein
VSSLEAPKWAIGMLLGGAKLFGVATVQVTRRFERLHLGGAVDFAAGRTVTALYVPGEEESPLFGRLATWEYSARTALELTLSGIADVDLIRRGGAYLQLGAALGYRNAGIAGGGRLSGTDAPLFALSLRFSAGFELPRKRAIVLRCSIPVLPEEHPIGTSAGRREADPFGSSVQLGYVIGF